MEILGAVRKGTQKFVAGDEEALAEALTSAEAKRLEAKGVIRGFGSTSVSAMTKAELAAALEARGIDPAGLEGTGSSGNIVRDDLAAALEAAQEED